MKNTNDAEVVFRNGIKLPRSAFDNVPAVTPSPKPTVIKPHEPGIVRRKIVGKR